MSKTVIITGAANGVGKSITKTLVAENLILIDIDEENLKMIAEETNSKYYVCDVSKADQVANLVEDIKENYNTIDCLINCAGLWISGEMSQVGLPEFSEMNDLDRIRKVIDTNIFGVVAMIKSVYPIMEKQGQGQIININSQSGVICEPPFPSRFST